jgi:hypothetical protein
MRISKSRRAEKLTFSAKEDEKFTLRRENAFREKEKEAKDRESQEKKAVAEKQTQEEVGTCTE